MYQLSETMNQPRSDGHIVLCAITCDYPSWGWAGFGCEHMASRRYNPVK